MFYKTTSTLCLYVLKRVYLNPCSIVNDEFFRDIMAYCSVLVCAACDALLDHTSLPVDRETWQDVVKSYRDHHILLGQWMFDGTIQLPMAPLTMSLLEDMIEVASNLQVIIEDASMMIVIQMSTIPSSCIDATRVVLGEIETELSHPEKMETVTKICVQKISQLLFSRLLTLYGTETENAHGLDRDSGNGLLHHGYHTSWNGIVM